MDPYWDTNDFDAEYAGYISPEELDELQEW
jgi:hypothetical protein